MSTTVAPAAGNSLTRYRLVTLVVVSVAAAYAVYYLRSSRDDFEQPIADGQPIVDTPAGGGLHRSNAVHRPRRRRRNEVTATEDENAVPEHQRTDEERALALEVADRLLAEELSDAEASSTTSSDYETVPWTAPRNGQNMVQLLFNISEDATRRNAYIHRGTLCNGCGTVPIRGIRYRCANCADFDLCETCESQGQHYRTHVFYKIKVPITNYEPRQMQAPFYPGIADWEMKSLPREVTTQLAKETGLDRPEIEAYWDQWTCMANIKLRDDPEGLHMVMDRKTFYKHLVPSNSSRYAAPNLIHDRMFAFYDQNKDDMISFPEYLHGVAYRKVKNKLKRVFDGYDINGDGYVDRKDFLRMFQSYYVLYKNMRNVMLESMDESSVNSLEAQAIINGRGALSGAFGRDGNYGSSYPRERGHGKRMASNGEFEIADGQGILSADSEDHGDRRDVFQDNFSRALSTVDLAQYLSIIMNPSSSVTDLEQRLAQQLEGSGQADEEEWYDVPRHVSSVDVEHVLGRSDIPVQDVPASERARVLRHSIRRHGDQLEELRSATFTTVDEAMHERWRRRQFYTDEEEGVEPPPGWKDEEELPRAEFEQEHESTPTRPPMSPTSRSSSRVRFVEDMDDYDTRSNPSTSSRSIPERWGGVDIADAERDVGKDILYQVTQQSFNELLDNLFKPAEDDAVTALASTNKRAKYRHLFENKYFLRWAHEFVDYPLADNGKTSKADGSNTRSAEQHMREWLSENDGVEEPVELDETRELEIDDLLARSGYSVVNAGHTPPATEGGHEHDGANDAGSGRTSPAPPAAVRRPIPRTSRRGSETPSDNLRRDIIEAFRSADPTLNNDEDEEEQQGQVSVTDSIPEVYSAPLPTDRNDVTDFLDSYRDPTLPQFRPSGIPPPAPTPPTARLRSNADMPQLENQGDSAFTHNMNNVTGRSTKRSKSKAKKKVDHSHLAMADFREQLLRESMEDPSIPIADTKQLEEMDWLFLWVLLQAENTEHKARQRGGWARLSYREFEDILHLKDDHWNREKKKMLNDWIRKDDAEKRIREREMQVVRLQDYLGSWIDLCIP